MEINIIGMEINQKNKWAGVYSIYSFSSEREEKIEIGEMGIMYPFRGDFDDLHTKIATNGLGIWLCSCMHESRKNGKDKIVILELIKKTNSGS